MARADSIGCVKVFFNPKVTTVLLPVVFGVHGVTIKSAWHKMTAKDKMQRVIECLI